MNFDDVVRKETDALRRKHFFITQTEDTGSTEERLNRQESLGLAISGGGIRSATFALGILQHLASLKQLRHLDYLSTVSGGGYIGSWLTAWLQRHFAKGGSWNEFEDKLKPAPDTGYRPTSGSTAKEPFPLRWLRKYGNYLSPDFSLFSADTWSILMIWVRNALLNQVILIAIVAAVLLLGRLVAIPFQWCCPKGPPALLLIASIFLALPVVWIVRRISEMARNPCRESREFRAGQTPAILASLSMLASAYCMSLALWWSSENVVDVRSVATFVFGVLSLLVMCVSMREPSARGVARCVIGAALGSGVFNGLIRLCELLFHTVGQYVAGQGIWAAAVGPTLLLWAVSLVVVVLLGAAGRHVEDEIREWWSRLGAWLGLVGLAAVAINVAAVFGPMLLILLWWKTWVGVSVGGGWLAATWAALKGAWGAESSGKKEGGRSLTDRLLVLAPPVLAAGIVLLVATGVDALLTKARADNWMIVTPPLSKRAPSCTPYGKRRPDSESVRGLLLTRSLWDHETLPWLAKTSLRSADGDAGTLRHAYLARMDEHRLLHILLLLGVCIVLVFLFGWLVDLNEFSMYAFYRNRLVRCYLGASKFDKDTEDSTRGADPFTNLGVKDDVPLDQLQISAASTYCGPIHLVNTAINLSGEESGRAERRASSFVFTPYACGYHQEIHDEGQYREIAADGKVTLGSVVTVSGAAASPNMGYHTSAPLAFLMTMFNVRLGLWFPNTANSKPSPEGPRFGIGYLLLELFALANRKTPYVYLSDGGHFENLAVYELLRRRCRYIIVCDGEADEGLAFEGLGGLIRKARADFGIEIEMDTSAISTRSESGFSQAHCATGVIRYPDPAATGTLLYLKASVTGDEPGDVLHYRSTHKEFPHQSTGDQFFSESQFESYRRLGIHVAEQAFRVVNRESKGDLPENHDMFLQLRQAWRGSPTFSRENFTDHTRKLQELMDQLRTEKDLAHLSPQIYPEWRHFEKNNLPNDTTKIWELGGQEFANVFYFCHNLIQLMEEVYLDLDLEANADHPDMSGWMNLFQHWAWSDLFRFTYAIVAPTFGGRFRRFCERHFLLRLDQDAKGASSLKIKSGIDYKEATETERFTAWEVEFLEAFEWGDVKSGMKVRQILCKVPNALHPDDTKDFPIGFAIVGPPIENGEPPRLCWIRIQNHLRCMGFGRAAIEQLKEKHKGLNMDDEGDDVILARVTDPRFGDSGTKAHLAWVRERLKSD